MSVGTSSAGWRIRLAKGAVPALLAMGFLYFAGRAGHGAMVRWGGLLLSGIALGMGWRWMAGTAITRWVGAYLAILGRTDVVSFTAGVGENVAAVRLDALSGLQGLGIEIDEQRNAQSAKGARRISTDASAIVVLVVPTNEELAIARDCLRAI